MDSRYVLLVLIALSVVVGGYEAIDFYHGHLAGADLQRIWAIVFVLLLASWIQLDAKKHDNVARPFDFGFLVLVFWPFYLPYYLVRTRRALGIVWLAAFGCLLNLGYLLMLLIYAAH